MELSAAMEGVLARLSAAIDDADIDIADSVRHLAASVRDAVPAYLGLSLSIEANGTLVVLPTMEMRTVDADIATSLCVRLAQGAESDRAGNVTLIFYGANPGAFVDLAADMGWLIGDTDTSFAFDTHLFVPVESVEGLDDLSMVNQAIGALIAGGYPVEQANGVLDALASDEGVARHTVARLLLSALDEERRAP